MKKSLIVEISEGLGNQLFMYSNAFALAKDNKIDLLIDNTSGYFRKKNKLRGQQYFLDHFNIKQDIAPAHLKSDTFFKYFKKKLDLKLDNFRSKKNYLFEDNNPVKFQKNF